MTQREVDIEFVDGLREFLRARLTFRQWRKLSRRQRVTRAFDRAAARVMVLIFARRIRRNRHPYPTARQVRWMRRFTFGRYCGVGHGQPSGETRRPLGRVDALCMAHDIGTASIREAN